jgi:hypothetical protein
VPVRRNENGFVKQRIAALLHCAKFVCPVEWLCRIHFFSRVSSLPYFLGRFLPKLGGASAPLFFRGWGGKKLRKTRGSFLKKTTKKLLLLGGRGRCSTGDPKEQSFFASFCL